MAGWRTMKEAVLVTEAQPSEEEFFLVWVLTKNPHFKASRHQ